MLKCFLDFFAICALLIIHILLYFVSSQPSVLVLRTRAVSNKTRILHAQHQSSRRVWPNCFASCPHSFGTAPRCLRISLLMISCAGSSKKRSLMTGLQCLKAVGELFNYNFQSRDVANHTIDKQALHDNQAVLRKLFDFSTVFSKVVLQKGIEKYVRRIGVCIKSCREDAYILKRTQMDCRFFFKKKIFLPTFCSLGFQPLQIGSNMKSGTRLLDWLHEFGKLANGLAGEPSSPTWKDKF